MMKRCLFLASLLALPVWAGHAAEVAGNWAGPGNEGVYYYATLTEGSQGMDLTLYEDFSGPARVDPGQLATAVGNIVGIYGDPVLEVQPDGSLLLGTQAPPGATVGQLETLRIARQDHEWLVLEYDRVLDGDQCHLRFDPAEGRMEVTINGQTHWADASYDDIQAPAWTPESAARPDWCGQG
ncbi:MAG: hypothetical protein Q4G26_10785 [Paracoccus sp. (in: a-proteobacteria)]|nr:hypothetical protein [Paracoccus sp. (in: a-proteobacteria)]